MMAFLNDAAPRGFPFLLFPEVARSARSVALSKTSILQIHKAFPSLWTHRRLLPPSLWRGPPSALLGRTHQLLSVLFRFGQE